MKGSELIIEIPYGGLGDHLFHSHLPRIAKQTGAYDNVYISSRSLFRHPDNKKLVWDLNPYIDGFVDEPGKTFDFKPIVRKHFLAPVKEFNLLDSIMFHYQLEDNIRWHEPEIYYKPEFKVEYHKSVFDPNYLSWVGEIEKKEMMSFIHKNNYSFDAVMMLRNNKALFIPEKEVDYIETNTLFDFCDLIFSSKNIYCLTSGTATIAAGLGKNATVFFGNNQSLFYQHSKLHTYIKVPQTPINAIKQYLFKKKKKYFGS